MKKFITAIVAAMMFTSTVAVANTTDAINQYQSTNTDSAALKPVEKEDNGTEEARKAFVNLTEEVIENAKMVRFLGAHWSVAHTEGQRLLLLKQKAEAKSKSYEQRIGKIVEEQQELTSRSIVLVRELQAKMDPDEFNKLRMEFIVPHAIQLETMKQASIQFVQGVEASHQNVANNPDVLTVENHIALTKYDIKQLEKFLELSGNTITE